MQQMKQQEDDQSNVVSSGCVIAAMHALVDGWQGHGQDAEDAEAGG
jgi:hypothetical protein